MTGAAQRCGLSKWLGTALFALCLMGTAAAQRNVLVIPFDRFEFHTEIPLQTINQANGFELDQFYPALVRTLSDAFNLASSKEISYQLIGENDYDKLRRYFRFSVDGKDGHFKCSLDQLHKTMYKQILDDYNCDYMLVIDWYRIIQKKESAVIGKTKTVDVYSLHYLDYDLFNREMLHVHWESRVKIQVEATAENLKYHGLRLTDLRSQYQDVVARITKNILGKP